MKSRVTARSKSMRWLTNPYIHITPLSVLTSRCLHFTPLPVLMNPCLHCTPLPVPFTFYPTTCSDEPVFTFTPLPVPMGRTRGAVESSSNAIFERQIEQQFLFVYDSLPMNDFCPGVVQYIYFSYLLMNIGRRYKGSFLPSDKEKSSEERQRLTQGRILMKRGPRLFHL